MSVGFNKRPLTLEKLRKMDGKPVQYEATGEIFIVELNHPDFGECVINESGYYIPLHRAVNRSAGRRFFDYTHPSIDREAWEPCGCCKSAKFMNGNAMHNFCPDCGRPLTNAAREMLKKRLEGNCND